MPLDIDPSAVLVVLAAGASAVAIVRIVANLARRRVRQRTRELLKSSTALAPRGAADDNAATRRHGESAGE